MKSRKQFIAALLGAVGIGRAQESGPVQPFWKIRAAINNQCPVCGEMARPYKREMVDAYHGMMFNCQPVAGQSYAVSCDPPKMVPDGPPEKTIRCKRCNAAFWQDAEK